MSLISLLIEFGSKTIKENTTKNKFIRHLCFIADFIQSCHHCLKMSILSLEKNRLRSIDLTPLAINVTTAFTALDTSCWKDFSSRDDSSHLKYSPSFQISWTCSDVFQIGEKFNHQLSGMFTCRDGNAGVLSSQAMKCYIHRVAR